MLQSVRDACNFRQDAINFALTKQIEDLTDLSGHDEVSACAFFGKIFVTEGMSTLLRQALQRRPNSTSGFKSYQGSRLAIRLYDLRSVKRHLQQRFGG